MSNTDNQKSAWIMEEFSNGRVEYTYRPKARELSELEILLKMSKLERDTLVRVLELFGIYDAELAKFIDIYDAQSRGNDFSSSDNIGLLN